MQEYLLFRIYGAIVSWGDITVGEIRPTASYPSKSAIVGLLSASFGFKREQIDEITSLSNSIGYAVRVDAEGMPLRDYHTAQKPDAGTGRNFRTFSTRREELLHDKIDTALSTRDYRTDALYTVCLWKTTEEGWTLEEINERLKYPVFQQYFGRKSCVVSLPIQGVIHTAKSISNAFESVELRDTKLNIVLESEEINLLKPIVSRVNGSNRYFWEDCDHHGFSDSEILMKTLRRDVPRSRTAWQFGERYEYSAVIPNTQPQEQEASDE
jgi:CRISPR system Cascade subunit CasD